MLYYLVIQSTLNVAYSEHIEAVKKQIGVWHLARACLQVP